MYKIKSFMKATLLMSVFVLTMISCSDGGEYNSTKDDLPAFIEKDFYLRYPDASINQFIKYSSDNTISILFTEDDGLKSTAIYQNGSWMMTEKKYDSKNYLFNIPRNVARTYLSTGVVDEEFNSDEEYIVEIQRCFFDQKQYEFHFKTPFTDELGRDTHLVNNIIISEDGSLLTFDHFAYNRSIWLYDIRDSYRCVTERYPSSSILGAANQVGNNIFYIKDNGRLKTVKTIPKVEGFEWAETQYPLDINTSLPESVELRKKTYETQHPDRPFFKLSFVEYPSGNCYRLSFGTEMNCYYLDIKE